MAKIKTKKKKKILRKTQDDKKVKRKYTKRKKRKYTKRKDKDLSNSVNHPSHYGGQNNPYEAIKIIEALNLDFASGNTLKYLVRAGKKAENSEISDLKKAAWYLNRKIENLSK